MKNAAGIRTGCALLIACSLLAEPAYAQVPALIRYQGQAVDKHDTPLEGPYTLTFRLYDAETGGTKLWEETQPAVPLTEGQFSVLLGSVTPLASMNWDAPRWLSIQVNDEQELAPRQRITSVPLALRAEVAETAENAAKAQTADRLTTAVSTSTISDDGNRLVPSGAIILWTSASCPAGYTRLVALDGKFLVGGASFNAAAGGSNTHTHEAGSYAGPSHTHTMATASTGNTCNPGPLRWIRESGGFAQVIDTGCGSSNIVWTGPTNSGGTGAVTGSSASADSRPEFATVLLCQKD